MSMTYVVVVVVVGAEYIHPIRLLRRLQNARPAPVERDDTTPLHDCNNTRILFPRCSYAGSFETRQQCARFDRILGNLLVVFIIHVTSIIRGLLCLYPRCSAVLLFHLFRRSDPTGETTPPLSSE